MFQICPHDKYVLLLSFHFSTPIKMCLMDALVLPETNNHFVQCYVLRTKFGELECYKVPCDCITAIRFIKQTFLVIFIGRKYTFFDFLPQHVQNITKTHMIPICNLFLMYWYNFHWLTNITCVTLPARFLN